MSRRSRKTAWNWLISKAGPSPSATAGCMARCSAPRFSIRPQSGILGMHKIEDRPVAVAGQVVIRPMMYVALTYDHRIDRRPRGGYLSEAHQGMHRKSRTDHAGDVRWRKRRKLRSDRHRRRTGRLRGRGARRPIGHEGGLHREGTASRRSLPQCRLHSQQGPAGFQRILPPGEDTTWPSTGFERTEWSSIWPR